MSAVDWIGATVCILGAVVLVVAVVVAWRAES